jgi:hypothetical protein
LIGVEMEAGGAAATAFQASAKPGFFMIRGVSDLADAEKDSLSTGRWRAYACDVAAAYLEAFLKSGPVKPAPKRRWWILLLVLALLVMFAGTVLVRRASGPIPTIERLVPIEPVAGEKLQVFGGELPTGEALAVRIGAEPVSEIMMSTPDYLEVRVPANATSGPLLVTKRGWPRDQSVAYPVDSVLDRSQQVALNIQDIRKSGEDVVISLSILNRSKQRSLTINDLRLKPIHVLNRGGPKYQQERIDLGVFTLHQGQSNSGHVSLTTSEGTSLMSDRYVFKLPPGDSDSLQVRLTSPSVQHQVEIAFIVVAKYDDDSGSPGECVGGSVLAFESSDVGGIALAKSYSLDGSTMEALERRYRSKVQQLKLFKEPGE